MRVLIVDDEPLARMRLRRMLEKVPDVEVVGEAGDGIEARERIAGLNPDQVLSDIRMPGEDGLGLAQGIETPVIFTTAYAEHAVTAFDVDALDYLLKPVARDRLEAALQRARERLGDLRIRVKVGHCTRWFAAADICRFHASDKYTLFTFDGEEHVLDESLNALEQRLPGFIRIHRRELINVAKVTALKSGPNPHVVLADGQHAQVSRRHAPQLKSRLEQG